MDTISAEEILSDLCKTPARVALLRSVLDRPTVSVTQLSEQKRVTKGTVSRTISVIPGKSGRSCPERTEIPAGGLTPHCCAPETPQYSRPPDFPALAGVGRRYRGIWELGDGYKYGRERPRPLGIFEKSPPCRTVRKAQKIF